MVSSGTHNTANGATGRLPRLFMALALVTLVVVAAGCSRRTSTPTPTPSSATGAETSAPLAERNTSRVISPTEGGVLALGGGAEVTIPRDSLSTSAVVTLRQDDEPPTVPIPRTLVGQAYQLSVDQGTLTGIALFSLPLPAGVTVDQYEVAAYRWNGRAWERLTARVTDDSVQFGSGQPGVFSIQGQWRLADLSLAVSMAEPAAGSVTTVVGVSGQYRYRTSPAAGGEYVLAHLLLKRDSSGGAGQVAGDESLDQTVAEKSLWFKPDPSSAEGLIDFSQSVELTPAQLEVEPGGVTHLYAVLTVDDSAAPTRRISSALTYTQMLPIQAIGAEIVRPALGGTSQAPLRWHVDLNEQPLLDEPATGLTLSLSDVLARGGLGQYRITLEVESDGAWHTVSNEVHVQLTLPTTATPALQETAALPTTSVSVPIVGGDEATPTPAMPPTPTRRPQPGEPSATPTIALQPTTELTALPTTAATATRPAWANVFWSDRYTLVPGECTTLHWNVENIIAIYLDGAPTTGSGARQICPAQTTVYKLTVTTTAGSQDRFVTVAVQTDGQPAIEFRADDYEVVTGQCTLLHWRATDVRAVYLNDIGVSGEASQQVCPSATTEFRLRVEATSGTTTIKTLTVIVSAAQSIVMRFWSEQYTLEPGKCTNLHWSVEDVQAVYLTVDGPEEGVAGTGLRQVCPTGAKFYSLRATASDDRTITKQVTIDANVPVLTADETIAQGVVNDVTFADDLDPVTAGNQTGWNLTVDGINTLFSGASGCCQTMVRLWVVQSLAGGTGGMPVDWPVSAGQLIEFRALCSNGICQLHISPVFYLRLRSD